MHMDQTRFTTIMKKNPSTEPIAELLDRIEQLEHRLEDLNKIETDTRSEIQASLTPIEMD